MKIFIASDIHGDLSSCEQMLTAYRREGADRLLILGDILYHGPRNDLPETYAPKRVIELLNPLKNEITAVRGNCDSEVDQMVLDFPIMSDYAIIEQDRVTVFATHGHKYNTSAMPPVKPGTVLLHGHTHVLKCEELSDGCVYINPGSVSLPKENNPKTYATYEDRTFTVKTLDGQTVFTKTIV